jgi:hypothetical protein
MAQTNILHARSRVSVLSAARRKTYRGRRSRTIESGQSLATEFFENVYECRVHIPGQVLIEIQDDGDDMLTVTNETGESFELSADAFVALTGREWSDIVTG